MISSSVLETYTGSSDTTTLTQLEAGTVAWLQGWIPRYLGTSTTLTEVLDGPRRFRPRLTGRHEAERLHTLWLSESIASGSLVSVEERETYTDDWTDLPNPADLTEYEIRTDTPYGTTGRQLIRKPQPWPHGHANLRIKYTHGYAEDSGPDDVTLAILQIVKGMLDVKEIGLLEGEEEGGVDIEYHQVLGLPGVDGNLLASLRRPGY